MAGALPAVADLYRKQLIPSTLRTALAEAKGRQADEMTAQDMAAFTTARMIEAAAFVRELYDEESDSWVPVQLSLEDLESGYFDRRDLQALDDFVMRAETADMINAGSALIAQLREHVEVIRREGAGDTVDGWAGFRGQRGRSGAGAGGEPVAQAAIRAVADNRASRRARGRRGPGGGRPAVAGGSQP